MNKILHTYMARAVAFATETSAESSYFLTQRNCGQVTAHTATARQSPGQRFVYIVTMNIQRGQFSVEMITDFQVHLVFDEFRWDGKASANTTGLRRKLHPHCRVCLLQ